MIMIEDRMFVNIRGVNYSLYHSEGQQKFQSFWGKLAYLHPEDDMHLRTNNFFCELDPQSLKIISHVSVDTSEFDREPLWEFVGLEDARLVHWDRKIGLSGVRRDTTPNGVGRIEISTISADGRELSRARIEAPENTYCEKNWMPIQDMPYHYVKWCTPTEIVLVDTATCSSKSVKLVSQTVNVGRDIRGGSQVIPYKDYHVAITHEVDLWLGKMYQKDAQYYHRFIVWDKDWNIVRMSEDFKFTNARIEFSCGLAHHENHFYATFGFQDSTSFIVKFTEDFFESFVGLADKELSNWSVLSSQMLDSTWSEFLIDSDNAAQNFRLGEYYFNHRHYPSALSFFLRAAEFTDDNDLAYEALILVGSCLSEQGGRPTSETKVYNHAVGLCPLRPEAYLMMSFLLEKKKEWKDAYTMICNANHAIDNAKPMKIGISFFPELCKFQTALTSLHVGLIQASRDIFSELAPRTDLPCFIMQPVRNILLYLNSLEAGVKRQPEPPASLLEERSPLCWWLRS